MGLGTAIKKTISYAKQYDCNLNLEEIKERLISNKVYSDEEIDKKVSNIKYQVLNIKNKNQEIKIKKAEELVKKYLEKFKDILMVGITGSVAAGYPLKNDDIDLMIVTKKNRLWWTRLKLRYFMYKNKIPHRTYEAKENKDEFCFNLWLDESNLIISKNRRNLRSAMDLILMKPILNRENIYEKFMLKNDWVKKYVATGYNKKVLSIKYLVFSIKKEKNNFWDRVINFLVFIPQYLFMKRKMKNGEDVGLKKAFFNKVYGSKL